MIFPVNPMTSSITSSISIPVALIGAVAQFGLGLLLLAFFSRMPDYGGHRALIKAWMWVWLAYVLCTVGEALTAIQLLTGTELLPMTASVVGVTLALPFRWLFLSLVVAAAWQSGGQRVTGSRYQSMILAVPTVAFLLSLSLQQGLLLTLELLAVPMILFAGIQLVVRSKNEQRNRGLATLAVAMFGFALLRVPQLLIETTLKPGWVSFELDNMITMISPWADLISLVVLASGVVLLILQDSVIQASDERETFERKVAEAEKMVAMGRVMSGVAHELNNPLSVVLGQAEQLAEKGSEGDAAKSSVELIHQNAIRARHIVRDLLTFVRRPQDSSEATALRPLVDSILRLQSAFLREREVKLEVDIPESITVHGSPVALEQVFGNLIDNAVFAAGVRGTVWLRATTDGDSVELRVEDSGAGVAEEHLDRLFEPFFTTKSIGQGTGLGLSLAKGILEQHGGTLVFENRPREGVGASMIARMPLPRDGDVLRQSADGGTGSTQDDWRQIGRKSGVLVVDDEPAVRSTIVRILGAWDWSAREASSVDEALVVLRGLADEDLPAAILCDMKMPEKDGAEFYKILEETHPALSHRMVFVTGNALEAGTAEFLAKSGRQVVEKPFTIEELAQALERSIGALVVAEG